MRRILFGTCLLVLASCAQTRPDGAVYFTDFSSSLDQTATEIVRTAADMASRMPTALVRVTGYADSAGSTQADISLSRARADAVANLLVQDGVAQARVVRSAVGTPPNGQPGVERRRVTIDVGGR